MANLTLFGDSLIQNVTDTQTRAKKTRKIDHSRLTWPLHLFNSSHILTIGETPQCTHVIVHWGYFVWNVWMKKTTKCFSSIVFLKSIYRYNRSGYRYQLNIGLADPRSVLEWPMTKNGTEIQTLIWLLKRLVLSCCCPLHYSNIPQNKKKFTLRCFTSIFDKLKC